MGQILQRLVARIALSWIAVSCGASAVAETPAAGHWAFRPLSEAAVPPIDGQPAAKPVDAFIRVRLAQAGLSPAPAADRGTLLRRLYFDMHGLPPSLAQVEAFLGDEDPAAYARRVEAVLESPRYGERWAQHWLDLIRYADTHGFEVNTERANAWPFRDYVIRAFNEDKPYDRFVFEQLAGDSAGEDAATGFLVASAVLLPGQIGKDEESKRLARQDALDEIIVATSDTFLGLSVGCARCHDHKFDPIPQRNYYAMQAFFAGVEYGDRPMRNPAAARELQEFGPKVAAIRKRLDGLEPTATPGSGRLLLIDEKDAERTEKHAKENGDGANPAGSGRGYRDDPGSGERLPNLGRGSYKWWDNKPGEDVFSYDPGVEGTFRIWLSWGVHGSGVHTRDARYVLDLDGDLATRDDQLEIAKVDQYHFAGVSSGVSEKKPLWSGLFDAGLHDLKASSRIVLRGGETGTAITADTILLERVAGSADEPSLPRFRAPVNAKRNVERLAPVEAKYVRFTSIATVDNNKHEPCIDELEIYTAGPETKNVALAEHGAKPSSSGNCPETEDHLLKHINDGLYGNSRSWISNQHGRGWVQIELPEPSVIDRIVWGRDREEKFKDRLAVRYRIEVAVEPGQWTTVASSDDRVSYGGAFDSIAALQRNLPAGADASVKKDAEELQKLERRRRNLENTQLVYGGIFRKPDVTHLLYRGDPEQKREKVGPAVLDLFGSKLTLAEDAPEQERRIALARWLGRPDNPLTARVMVNRVWQWHFDRGLVRTASDFGLNGTKPSHPQLLDWLAAEFIRSGWSVKHLHRLILLSDTYRQSNRIDAGAAKVDAGCRLLWRFPSRRLEAEAIRDSILAVSGMLNLEAMGDRGFDFFKKRGGLDGYPPLETFPADGLRRMIYAHKVRMERVPVFGAFDCPDAGQATPIRSRSTTAIQALNLFNSPFVNQQAEAFAARVTRKLGENSEVKSRVEHAYRLAFGRLPRATEAARSEAAVRDHGLATLCRVLFNSNEFLFLP